MKEILQSNRLALTLCMNLEAIRHALFVPKKFSEFEKNYKEKLKIPKDEDNNAVKQNMELNNVASHDAQVSESAKEVAHSFWYSLIYVVISGFIGYTLGFLFNKQFGSANSNTIKWIQVIGASLLLWGTLFVLGWEIQTADGKTLIEKVNKWLYRLFYCIGTALFMLSLAWSST